jgi:8-oxo-dGTP pyrophosphatase MutT (NUDIX family)
VEWRVHGERSVYDSDWVCLRLVDVEVPGRGRWEHHLIRYPHPAVGVIVVRPSDGALLLLWRHRYVTDTWGWEVPAGRIEEGEDVATAAVRETEEETGWRPEGLEPLLTYHPMNGTADQTYHLLRSYGATKVGEIVDTHESTRVEWVPADRLAGEIQAGRVTNGLSLTAVLAHLAS